MIDQDKFNLLLVKHKQTIDRLGYYCRTVNLREADKKLNYMFDRVKQQSTELCLVMADFRCEKCKKEENLQRHHLIMRNVKNYTSFSRYITQRMYWANIIILCRDCHLDIHNCKKLDEEKEEIKTLSSEYVDRIKKRYTI